MFVLITTANFPDVMLSAYYQHRAIGIFFIIYLNMGLYLLMNMLVAIFYDSYQTTSTSTVDEGNEIRNNFFNELFDKFCVSMPCHNGKFDMD
jgi:hypothetical protein